MLGDKRLTKRYHAHINVHHGEKDHLASASLVNLSRDGACIETAQPLTVHSKIKMWLYNTENEIPLEGKIMWQSSQNIGVKFVDLHPNAKAIRDDLLLTLMYKEHRTQLMDTATSR